MDSVSLLSSLLVVQLSLALKNKFFCTRVSLHPQCSDRKKTIMRCATLSPIQQSQRVHEVRSSIKNSQKGQTTLCYWGKPRSYTFQWDMPILPILPCITWWLFTEVFASLLRATTCIHVPGAAKQPYIRLVSQPPLLSQGLSLMKSFVSLVFMAMQFYSFFLFHCLCSSSLFLCAHPCQNLSALKSCTNFWDKGLTSDLARKCKQLKFWVLELNCRVFHSPDDLVPGSWFRLNSDVFVRLQRLTIVYRTDMFLGAIRFRSAVPLETGRIWSFGAIWNRLWVKCEKCQKLS